MKIAFCTNDLEHVDEHFGRASTIAVYDVSLDGHAFVELRNFEPDKEDELDRIDNKISALKDCIIVYVNQIGGTAAAKVVKAKIHPVKVEPGASIIELLERTVDVISTNPPPWMKKALMRDAEST